MAALSYLLRRNILNYIKSLKKMPGLLAMYIVFLLLIVMMLVFGSNDEFSGNQWLTDDMRTVIFAALPLLALYFTVSNGLKKGSTFFRMADVNFVFSSPIDRRPILIYGFVRQLGISLLIVAWLFFQIANLQQLFAIPFDRLWIFFVTVLIAVLYMPVCSMAIHAAVLKRPGLKAWLNRLLLGFFAVLGGAFVVLLVKSGDPVASAHSIVGSPVFHYLPVIGWLKAMLEASVTGFSTYGIVSFGLLVAGLAGVVWYLLSADIDYFEEVLTETERREQMIADKRAGKTNFNQNTKVRKARSYYRGSGPSAIFFRQLLEYRKSGIFLLDKGSILLAVIGLGMAYFLRDNPMRMEYMLYASIYLLFILSMAGRWSSEMNHHVMYLMPGLPLAKLWYATLANHIKHLFDGLLLFVIAGAVFGTPIVHSLLLAGCYAGFGALYVYSDVFFMRIFGTSHENFAAAMLKLLSISILAGPALVIVIWGAIIAQGSLTIIGLSYVAVIAYAVLASFLVMLLGTKLFKVESR
jgi:hypothetical protein